MMFFNHERVRQFLLEHGEVYTLRPTKRREGRDLFVYGSRYRHTKLGYGEARFIKSISELEPRALGHYVRKSGFANSKEWIDAFMVVNKKKEVEEVYLYHAIIMKIS